MFKYLTITIIFLFTCNYIFAQSNKNNLLTLAIAGPEIYKVSGFNDSSKLSLTGLLFKLEYSRLFKITDKLKLGGVLSYQRSFVKIKLETEGFGKNHFIQGDFWGYGLGINSFYKIKSLKDNKSLFLNFEATWLHVPQFVAVYSQVFYPDDTLTYQNAVAIDYYGHENRINGTLSINLNNAKHKHVEYNLSVGITGMFPFMRDSWFVFYRRHNDEEVQVTTYKQFNFIHPVFAFSVGF